MPKFILHYGHIFIVLLFFFSPMCLGMEEDIEEVSQSSSSTIRFQDANRIGVNPPPTERSPLVIQQQPSIGLNLQAQAKKIQRALENVMREESSAVVVYTLTTERRGRNWDSLDQFLDNLDVALLQPLPTSVKVGKGIGSLGGVLTPVFLSNTVLYSTGNLLDTDLGSVAAPTLEGWLITTTMPAAMRVAADLGGDFVALFSRKQPFSSSQGENTENKPHVFPKSKGHKAARGILLITTFLDAAVPAFFMFNAEAYFTVGRWVSLPFTLGFYWKSYWDIGQPNINRLFNNYVYQTDENDRIKRRVIAEKVELFKKAINHPDRAKSNKLVQLVYQALSEKLKRQKLRQAQQRVNPQRPEESVSTVENPMFQEERPESLLKGTSEALELSVFSLLMTQDAKRQDMTHVPSPDEPLESSLSELDNIVEDQIARLQRKVRELEEENRQFARAYKQAASLHADLGSLQPPSWKEDLLDAASTALTGMALFGRFEMLRYTIQTELQKLGVDEASARDTAYSIAGSVALFRASIEARLHQQQFKGWLSTFSLSKLGDFRFVRKGANFVSAVNGALFSVPNLLIGFTTLSSYPLLGQLAFLVPGAILDFSLFSHVFGENYNNDITDVATLQSEDVGVERQRAHLNNWANKVLERIVPTSGEDVFDQETIANIYSITQENALNSN